MVLGLEMGIIFRGTPKPDNNSIIYRHITCNEGGEKLDQITEHHNSYTVYKLSDT